MPPHTLLPPPSHIQRQLREALWSRFPPNPPAPLGPNALAGGPRLSPPIDGGTGPFRSVNAAVVLILAVLMCFVACALAVHTAVRCALAVLGRLRSEAVQPCGSDRVSPAGVGKGEALAALPVLVYFWGLGVPRAAPECAICLTEFEPGERIRVLPECGHAFHVGCIDRWLLAQVSCPTCRHSLQPHVVV